MASGSSWNGGIPRCFVYWQEFQKCYIQTDSPNECTHTANDYLECLHRPKETARVIAIEQERLLQVEKAAKEDRNTSEALADGVVVGIGLMRRQASEDEKSR